MLTVTHSQLPSPWPLPAPLPSQSKSYASTAWELLGRKEAVLCEDGGSQTLALQLGQNYIMLIIPGTHESEREFSLQLASREPSYSLARSREETLGFVLEDG